ncbi:MAG: hypothetical protein ACAH80_11220 [Alphaproteobacteria bacterium]
MRHAIAMFGFCLLLPLPAHACMPMEGSMGTQGLVVLVSFFLGVIMLFCSMIYGAQLLRLPKGSPAYPALRRKCRTAFPLAVSFIGFSFLSGFVDTSALVVAGMVAVLLYKIVLPVLVRLVMQAANALHSIKIAGEKTSSTRRLAAAGDVQ